MPAPKRNRRTEERQAMIRHAYTEQGVYGGDREVTDELVARRANAMYRSYLDTPITADEVPAAITA